MTTSVFTDDTITLQAIFKDINGALIDPDNFEASLLVYRDDTGDSVDTQQMTRSSAGTYTIDWLVPSEETAYIVEMRWYFSSSPQLKRLRIRARFRP